VLCLRRLRYSRGLTQRSGPPSMISRLDRQARLAAGELPYITFVRSAKIFLGWRSPRTKLAMAMAMDEVKP
jgi:hypothetical protein